MTDQHAIIAGAEAWSSRGRGARERIGIGLIHGLTGNPVSMNYVARALADRGFRVDVPRLPGHGTHWRDMAETRYADWRGETSRTVDRLRADCDTVVLLGLSMGGTLVLDVGTERQGDVAAIFAINAAILPGHAIQRLAVKLVSNVLPAVPGFVAGLTKNDIAKGGDERAYPLLPLKPLESLIDAMPGIADRLGRLEIPVVIAHSRTDHSVPPANSKKAFSLIGSSDKELLVLERSYHVATMDYDADVIVEAAERLADRVAASQAASD